jgi:hypothetical protein
MWCLVTGAGVKRVQEGCHVNAHSVVGAHISACRCRLLLLLLQGAFYGQLSVLDRLMRELKAGVFLDDSTALGHFLNAYCAGSLLADAAQAVPLPSENWRHTPTKASKLPADRCVLLCRGDLPVLARGLRSQCCTV